MLEIYQRPGSVSKFWGVSTITLNERLTTIAQFVSKSEPQVQRLPQGCVVNGKEDATKAPGFISHDRESESTLFGKKVNN